MVKVRLCVLKSAVKTCFHLAIRINRWHQSDSRDVLPSLLIFFLFFFLAHWKCVSEAQTGYSIHSVEFTVWRKYAHWPEYAGVPFLSWRVAHRVRSLGMKWLSFTLLSFLIRIQDTRQLGNCLSPRSPSRKNAIREMFAVIIRTPLTAANTYACVVYDFKCQFHLLPRRSPCVNFFFAMDLVECNRRIRAPRAGAQNGEK